MDLRTAYFRHPRSWVLMATLLGLAGCSADGIRANDPPLQAGISDLPRSVLVLPGPIQLELAELTGIPVIEPTGRRDVRLGGSPESLKGQSVVSVQIRDDQRVINGRVRSQTQWRTRTRDTRLRVR